MSSVASIFLPDEFNAASYFVDRHIKDGRADKVAIECGQVHVTYRQLFERVNQIGNGLRALGVRIEERVFLLLLDSPEFAASFFGAIKIGAVPVPVNTLLKPADYQYILNNSRARVAIVSDSLYSQLEAIPKSQLHYLQHVMVIQSNPPEGDHDAPRFDSDHNHAPGTLSFNQFIAQNSPELDPEPTSKDDAA